MSKSLLEDAVYENLPRKKPQRVAKKLCVDVYRKSKSPTSSTRLSMVLSNWIITPI